MSEEYIGFYKSPVGWIKIVVSESGLKELDFVYKAKKQSKHTGVLAVKRQLDEYFKKKRKSFALKLDLEGTEFQKKVWTQLLQIPFGEAISYVQLATRVESPRAVRAVGNANGKNPIPVVVPCHRVIASPSAGLGEKRLGGYSAGIERKKWLLNHENVVF